MRFACVLEAVEGVSQKVLTRTLRQLECDGFISRAIFAEIRPRVEYQLTDLGVDMLTKVEPLFAWVVVQVDSFSEARTRFSARA
jgi:DNA-binding HxlR family transcriptional regulator